MSDLDVLKEIPGYKAILKSVLKSQIQLLMQQLSEHAGEESIIMTASVHDGTLSHLGSSTGKGFLEGRDEIKSQFLGYCLKTYHKQKTHEPQKPYQRTHPSPRSPAQMSLQSSKRPRLHSASPGNTYPPVTSSFPPSSGVYLGQSGTDSGSADDIVQVKTEITDHQSENSQTRTMDTLPRPTAIATIPDTIHLPHTLTTGANTPSTQMSSDLRASVSSIESETGHDANDTEDTDSSNISNIKVEQVEDELEITGVEMAAANWGQGQGQIGFGTDDDTSFNQSANQSGYINGGLPQRQMPDDCYTNEVTNLSLAQLLTQCPYCGKAFGSKKDLRRHVMIHEGLKPFTCDICGKEFRLKHHLKSHKFLVHSAAM